MNPQKYWRRIASGSLFGAAVLAVYAAGTDLLRDSLIHIVLLFSEPTNELRPTHSFLFCFAYWLIFGICIFVTLYIAVLDIRYLRMQFAMEKRALTKQSWESPEFRKILKTAQGDKDEKEE